MQAAWEEDMDILGMLLESGAEVLLWLLEDARGWVNRDEVIELLKAHVKEA